MIFSIINLVFMYYLKISRGIINFFQPCNMSLMVVKHLTNTLLFWVVCDVANWSLEAIYIRSFKLTSTTESHMLKRSILNKNINFNIYLRTFVNCKILQTSSEFKMSTFIIFWSICERWLKNIFNFYR